MKSRLSGQGGVANPRDTSWYRCGLRLALTRNASGDAVSRRAATEAVITRVQQDGTCFTAGAQWRGEWVMRLSVTSGATMAHDIEISAAAIVAAWRAVRPRGRRFVFSGSPARAWTLGSLSTEVGASRAAFVRRFHERVGEPPMTFLKAWRMALAADLLGQANQNVASVADKVGYSSPFAFSTAFRCVRGLTPQAHRIALLDGAERTGVAS